MGERSAAADQRSPTARASEAIESRALSELHRAAPPKVREAIGLKLVRVDGVTASVAARAGNIVINRVIGLGVDKPATAGQLEAIRRIYSDAAVERYFIHAAQSAHPRPLSKFLEGAGFRRDRSWMKFRREGGSLQEPVIDLEVREIAPEQGYAFGRIAGQAFGLGEPFWAVLASLVGRPGWRIFMSFDNDVPAGAGALFVHGDVGWTDWGATDPAFRSRGSQAALLARRVNTAREMGCRRLFTCTGEAVDDEEQHSYRNILRAGFVEAGLRPNYSPTGRIS